MTEPLSWTWLGQVVVLILVVAGVLALLIALAQRRRPLRVEVLTHEVNKTWEEVRAEIEAQQSTTPQYQYTSETEARLKDQGVKREP